MRLICSKSEANDSEQSPTKPATKKRARAKKITEDEIEEFVDEPAPKKAKAGGRKGKKAGAAEIEPIAEEKAPLAPKKAKRATKTAKVATGETKAEKDVEASSGATKDGRVAKQPKGRKKAAKTSVEKSEEEDVDVDEDGEEPPKKKRGRKKAVGGLQKGVSKMTTRPRGKKATADV